MSQNNAFLTDVEKKSLTFMMKNQGCTSDEIELMFLRISRDIREFHEPKKSPVFLITLDWDACGVILSMYIEGMGFPNKVAPHHRRFAMYDHYHNAGMVDDAMEVAGNLLRDINRRVEAFKNKHPDGIVYLLNGSYRQSYWIDTMNRDNQNIPDVVGGINYREYEPYHPGVIPSNSNGLVCHQDGDLKYVAMLFPEAEYIPFAYADGDGPPGCSHGVMEMTCVNNRPKNLKNALGEPIQPHGPDKQGLVECHFAKIEKRHPGAEIKMVFYDDKKKYLRSIKETPMKKNWSVDAIHYEGSPQSDVPVPVEVFHDVSYKKASAVVGGEC
ncbi:MAG: hypothetical protein CMD74_02550 [Gammaproteobacteria bacterium]|nr:hypothetical protein [Gammaproteobacteria bacterium]